MAKHKKFKERTASSYDRKPRNLDDKSPKKSPLIVFSFKDFDRTQGQRFSEWEGDKLLALACEKLISLSQFTIAQAMQQQIIKIYSHFPPKSEFTHPKHISDDVKWASFRIQGKERIIGYFSNDEGEENDNVFYIVFLDKDHKFWISEKKNT